MHRTYLYGMSWLINGLCQKAIRSQVVSLFLSYCFIIPTIWLKYEIDTIGLKWPNIMTFGLGISRLELNSYRNFFHLFSSPDCVVHRIVIQSKLNTSAALTQMIWFPFYFCPSLAAQVCTQIGRHVARIKFYWQPDNPIEGHFQLVVFLVFVSIYAIFIRIISRMNEIGK